MTSIPAQSPIYRTASEEMERYWRQYIGTENDEVVSGLVRHDALWRERYLILARKLRHSNADLAAEYAKTAADMLMADSEVFSAPLYTLAAQFQTYDDGFIVTDRAGNLLNRAAAAASIHNEFMELLERWPALRADVGAHCIRLSNQMEEGVAVWREFMISVLVRQEAIRPLPWSPPYLNPTPADVVGKYENISEDSDYVIGFRSAATVALTGNPWFLSSAHLATSALRGPFELLRVRLPRSGLLRVQPDSVSAPDERLRRLVRLSADKELNAGAWMELAYGALGASTPSIPAIVEHELSKYEGEIR